MIKLRHKAYFLKIGKWRVTLKVSRGTRTLLPPTQTLSMPSCIWKFKMQLCTAGPLEPCASPPDGISCVFRMCCQRPWQILDFWPFYCWLKEQATAEGKFATLSTPPGCNSSIMVSSLLSTPIAGIETPPPLWFECLAVSSTLLLILWCKTTDCYDSSYYKTATTTFHTAKVKNSSEVFLLKSERMIQCCVHCPQQDLAVHFGVCQHFQSSLGCTTRKYVHANSKIYWERYLWKTEEAFKEWLQESCQILYW